MQESHGNSYKSFKEVLNDSTLARGKKIASRRAESLLNLGLIQFFIFHRPKGTIGDAGAFINKVKRRMR
ncbi:MAG: hypothetical protein DRG30_01390 [Epsilonproteobacteria bacterium]|nr:MAG: hypothetical protein DRG30_01390 [Campylobacterota bacterium]